MALTQHDSETAAHGQQVLTAVAFIYRKENDIPKIFLAKRADTKKFLPGVHELPGGHIDYGETMEIGLKREVMEEFGMSIQVGDPFAVFTYINEIKGSHSIEVVYFAQFTDPINQIQLNPEDHASFGWYAENELALIGASGKPANDPEVKAIKKGFALLRGEPLKY